MEGTRQPLRFDKCLCCGKNYNTSQLIELNSNSVIVGEESLLFCDLLLDVCLQRFDDGRRAKYLCESCKDQLVMFHMFKRDIKKYSDFQKFIARQGLLSEIDDALSHVSDLTGYSIHQINDYIIISKDPIDSLFTVAPPSNSQECIVDSYENEEEIMVEEVAQVIEEEYIEDPDMQETFSSYEQPSFRSEELIELAPVAVGDHQTISFSSPARHTESNLKDEAYEEEEEGWSEGNLSKRRKKYVYKANTNDNLTEDQLNWIKQQARTSELMVDGKRVYKCQICGQILQIPGSLKKHLRDCHILKSQNDQDEKNSKREFKNEVLRSKIEVDAGDGTIETIWKCERCPQDRVFRSEAGLKVHLRYNHIRATQIDVQFIAKCKISIDTPSGIKDAWKCPDCFKVLRSRDGLRNHMKLEHTEAIEHLDGPQQSIGNSYSGNNSLISSSEHLDKSSLLQLARRKQSSSGTTHVGCDQCGISFVNGTTKKDKSHDIHQQLHIILKVVSKSFDLPRCEDCKIMFCNNDHFNIHTISHDDEVFPAEGLSYLVAEKIKEPLGTAAADDLNAWQCGHCPNVRFADEIECIEHQMILHSKQLICPFDYLEFSGIRGLGLFSSHMKNKHPEMFPELSIICTYCGQEFSNIFDKLSHMKMCNEKKYFCDHCTKTFFKKTQLIRHLKIVSGAIAFICDFCSKNCASSMDLKLHYRAHTNEKTYQCTFPNCMKIFKTPAARSSHMEIHSNIEYECTDCKAIFKQRALLQRHLKKVKCKGAHAAKSNFQKM